MATILFANNASSTLAGPLTGTAATLNVAAGTGVLFPQPGTGQYFCLTLTDAATGLLNEILYVTAVNGDTFTIQRGQENTAPQSWLAGDLADNLITAGSLTAFAQSTSITSGTYQGTDTGTSPNTVIVASTTPSISAPVQGQYFQIVKSGSSNTGPVTCRIGSGGSAAGVLYKDGSALSAADWPANAAAILYFNGGVFQFVACAAPSPAQTTYGATEGVKNVNGTFSLDYPDLTAENTLSAADLIAFYASQAEGGQPGGHHYKVTADALASYVLSRSSSSVLGTTAYAPQAYTSSDTYTVPAGCSRIYARIWAPGGPGASVGGGVGGAGGGGGEYREGVFAVTPSQSIPLTITPPASPGNNSGITSLGSLMTAIGGKAGSGQNSPGAGGTGGAGGTLAIPGTAGGPGTATQNYIAGSPGGNAFGSAPSFTATGAISSPGCFPGGGGSGGNQTTGSPGAGGLIIIQAYP